MRFFERDAEGNRFAGKKKHVVLTACALVSLTVSLLLLEGALEIAGRIYQRAHRVGQTQSRMSGREVKDAINVLALGDSFTFGGRGVGSKSYPAVLAELLDRKVPKLTSVVNHGVCETTSKDLLENLATVTTFARPDLVLLLTGAANLFDPYPFADELMSTFQRGDSLIRRTHVYKLLRHLYYELIARTSWDLDRRAAPPPPSPSGQTVVGELMAVFDQTSRSPDEAQRRALLTPLATEAGMSGTIASGLLALLDRDEERALAIFRRLKKQLRAQGDPRAEVGLFLYMSEWRESLVRPSGAEKGIASSLFLLKLGPPEGLRHCVEDLMKAYYYDSSFDPMEAVRAIDDALEHDPLLHANKRLNAARIGLSDLGKWREHVGVWNEENLRTIIARLEFEDIRVVLQTYPISYEPINSITRKVAQEKQLPFVDHEKQFALLLAEDHGKYILDDQHCSDLGHEIMARNVMAVLDDAFLSQPPQLENLRNHCSSNWRRE